MFRTRRVSLRPELSVGSQRVTQSGERSEPRPAELAAPVIETGRKPGLYLVSCTNLPDRTLINGDMNRLLRGLLGFRNSYLQHTVL